MGLPVEIVHGEDVRGLGDGQYMLMHRWALR